MQETSKHKKGAILIVTFIILVTLTVIVMAYASMISYEIKTSGIGLRNMQAFYIAEAGLAKGRWALTIGGEAIGWAESDTSFGEGTYTVTTVDNGDSTYTIISSGYIPDGANPIAKRKVAERNIPISISSANLSISATVSASSEQGNSTADQVNDGDFLTKWRASGGDGSWVAIDFRSATLFDRVVFDEFGSKINTYEIQYSNNASSWTQVSNSTESVNGSTRTINFDEVSKRYVRIYISDTTNKPAINEFESYYGTGEMSSLGQGQFATSW